MHDEDPACPGKKCERKILILRSSKVSGYEGTNGQIVQPAIFLAIHYNILETLWGDIEAEKN